LLRRSGSPVPVWLVKASMIIGSWKDRLVS
jgi:hypothetical protein